MPCGQLQAPSFRVNQAHDGIEVGDKGVGGGRERKRESGGGGREKREFINPSITGVICQFYLPERKKSQFIHLLTLYKMKTCYPNTDFTFDIIMGIRKIAIQK